MLSQDTHLDPATASFIGAHAGVEAVGGQAVAAVGNLHLDTATTAVGDFLGSDRYLTSKAVAVGVVGTVNNAQHGNPAGIGIASGLNFPDALTGGAYAANAGRPLLLTDPLSLPGATADYLGANAGMFTAVTVFGGPAAVSPNVVSAIAARMNARIAP